MKRRDPGLAGVSGITAADVEALNQGRTTLQTIADRVGCSKQAVSRRIKAMRSTGASATAASPSSTSSTGASIPAGSITVDPAEVAVSACLGLLVRVHAALIGPDQIGPSGLKALSTTISNATSELRQLGIMSTAPDDAEVPTFTVRVLTDQEHDELKRKAELPGDDD